MKYWKQTSIIALLFIIPIMVYAQTNNPPPTDEFTIEDLFSTLPLATPSTTSIGPSISPSDIFIETTTGGGETYTYQENFGGYIPEKPFFGPFGSGVSGDFLGNGPRNNPDFDIDIGVSLVEHGYPPNPMRYFEIPFPKSANPSPEDSLYFVEWSDGKWTVFIDQGDGTPNTDPPVPDDNEVSEKGKSGNPIMFSLPGYGGIEKRDIYPDSHESSQRYFKLNNMCMVNMDIEYTSGFMLFWDHDYNWEISNGLEIGWTPHHELQTTSYTYFSQSVFDFNNNGMLDRYDTLWHSIKIKDMATGRVYKPLQLGIVAFQMDGWKHIPDDYVSKLHDGVKGQYLDELQYITDEAYYIAKDAGWVFYEIPEEYQHPVRALGWHEFGVIMEDGTTHPSFDVAMGYWGETSDC